MFRVRSRAGESADRSFLISRALNLALPAPAPLVPDPMVVGLSTPNENSFTAKVTDGRVASAGDRSRVIAGAAGAGRGLNTSPAGRPGPSSLLVTRSQDEVPERVASVTDPKANVRLSVGSPSPPETLSSDRTTSPKAQAATGLPEASRWVRTAFS